MEIASSALPFVALEGVPIADAAMIGQCAGVVELVDAPDSKSGSERSVGSIPTTRTTFN